MEMNCFRGIAGKFLEKRKEAKARRKALLDAAKLQHEKWKMDLNSVARMIMEGDFENADKLIRNLCFSEFEKQHTAKKALVPAMMDGNYGKVREIVKRYEVDDDTVCDAAIKAYDKVMEMGYYGDAIEISRAFGLVGKEREPAIILIQRYIRYNDENEARKLADRCNLEKEFKRILANRRS